MNFIKKIVDGKVDELVHLQFTKFSRGEFRYKAGISAKHSAGKWKIKTTAEFGNGLVRDVAEKVGSDRVQVTGAIVTTVDLEGELDYVGKKQFQGVKRYLIDAEMSGEEIISLLDKLPKAFFGLSFETEKDETKLKIKPKAPKSGKPGSKEGEMPKIDFCKLVTKDAELGKSFVFEKPDFKTAELIHTFFIEEMVRPEGETDFAVIREMAKRKGRIVRKGTIDEKEVEKEIAFEA